MDVKETSGVGCLATKESIESEDYNVLKLLLHYLNRTRLSPIQPGQTFRISLEYASEDENV